MLKTYPLKKQHFQTLKNIMLSENNSEYQIWSKTGWSGKTVGMLAI
ncbi:MAG: hypothetical protein V7782_04365 [Psychromonas sp.]